ncbi:bifunctional aminoglycoside phosphotransferase/ATP-binding protein [Nakamurella sp. GG22]
MSRHGAEQPAYADLRETHIGVVLLMGNRAYKFKKPVDMGFLDFRELPARVECCRREVELNRRLAPDVYLGVGSLVGQPGSPAEPVVVMRRMPEDRRLSTLLRSGEDCTVHITRLARMMAAFHTRSARAGHISAEGSRDAIGVRWAASLTQVAPFSDLVGRSAQAEIGRLVERFLAGRADLFARRIDQGRIVDGHGDLICDDIFCLPDGPEVLDCLEFDDRLRFVDGLDDVAFLAMDLEKLGFGHLSAVLLDSYADFAGDPAPTSLRHHYIAYRAFVRVKVDCLRAAQGDPNAVADAQVSAAIALRHLHAGTVRMILVGGLPGAGKTTIAGMTADRLGAVLLSGDRIRKECSGVSPLRSARAPYHEGIYDDAHTRRTYREILDRAADLLALGESVVLDASWTEAAFRADAVEVARQFSADLLQFECRAPPEVRHRRLARRRAGISDADATVADLMGHDAAAWPEAVGIDTTVKPEQTVEQMLHGIDTGIPVTDVRSVTDQRPFMVAPHHRAKSSREV